MILFLAAIFFTGLIRKKGEGMGEGGR